MFLETNLKNNEWYQPVYHRKENINSYHKLFNFVKATKKTMK